MGNLSPQRGAACVLAGLLLALVLSGCVSPQVTTVQPSAPTDVPEVKSERTRDATTSGAASQASSSPTSKPASPSSSAPPGPAPLSNGTSNATAETRADIAAGFDFAWTLGVGAPGAVSMTLLGTSTIGTIDVPPGATRLDVYANWTCVSPTCSLGAYVMRPGWTPATIEIQALDSPAAQAQGDGSLQASVEAPEPGTWSLWMQSEGAQVTVEGHADLVARMP